MLTVALLFASIVLENKTFRNMKLRLPILFYRWLVSACVAAGVMSLPVQAMEYGQAADYSLFSPSEEENPFEFAPLFGYEVSEVESGDYFAEFPSPVLQYGMGLSGQAPVNVADNLDGCAIQCRNGEIVAKDSLSESGAVVNSMPGEKGALSIAAGMTLSGNNVLLTSTTRFTDSGKNFKNDKNMCWMHSSANVIQYWQSYYGVFAKASDRPSGVGSLPYGLAYTNTNQLRKQAGSGSLKVANYLRSIAKKDAAASAAMGAYLNINRSHKYLNNSKTGFFSSYSVWESGWDLEGLSMQAVTSKLTSLMGYTRSGGKYVRTKGGQIAEIGIGRGTPEGHSLTCWGFTTNSAGNINSLYITDSDDKTYAMRRVYLKRASNGKIYLYSNAACTSRWSGKPWYLTDCNAIDTPTRLTKLYSRYSSKSNPLVWNGYKSGDTWTGSEKNQLQKWLPANNTGWWVYCSNGYSSDSKHYPIYYSTSRSVLFNDKAKDCTVNITGNKTVKAANMTIDNTRQYVFNRRGSTLLQVANLTKKNTGRAVFYYPKIKFGNISVTGGVLYAKGTGTFQGNSISISSTGRLQLINKQTLTLGSNITVGSGGNFMADSSGASFITLKLKKGKALRINKGATFTLTLDSGNFTRPVVSMTGSLLFSAGSRVNISNVNKLSYGKRYRLVKVSGFNTSQIKNVSVAGGKLGYYQGYLTFIRTSTVTSTPSSGGGSSSSSSSSGKTYTVSANSSANRTLGSNDVLQVKSSGGSITRLTGTISGSGKIMVPSGHEALLASTSSNKLMTASTIDISVEGKLHLGYSNQGVYGTLPDLSIKGSDARIYLYREGLSSNTTATIPSLTMAGGRLSLQTPRARETYTGSTDLNITKLSTSSAKANQLYFSDYISPSMSYRGTTINVGTLSGSGNLDFYSNTMGKLGILKIQGTSSYYGDVSVTDYAQSGVTSGYHHAAVLELQGGSYGTVSAEVLGDDKATGRAMIGINGSVTVEGLSSSILDKDRVTLYSGSIDGTATMYDWKQPASLVTTRASNLTIKKTYGSDDYKGAVYGPLNIIKEGDGKQTFSGDMSNFTGNITINGGTLAVSQGCTAGNLNIYGGTYVGDVKVTNTATLNGATIDSGSISFNKLVTYGANVLKGTSFSLGTVVFNLTDTNLSKAPLNLIGKNFYAPVWYTLKSSNIKWTSSKSYGCAYQLISWDGPLMDPNCMDIDDRIKSNVSGFCRIVEDQRTALRDGELESGYVEGTIYYYVADPNRTSAKAGENSGESGKDGDEEKVAMSGAATTEAQVDDSEILGENEMEQDGSELVDEKTAMEELEELIAQQEAAIQDAARVVTDTLNQSTWSTVAGSRAFVSAIENRGLNSGVVNNGKGLAWASALGVAGRTGSSSGHSGSEYHLGGAAVGVEAVVGHNSTMGLSLGNTWGKVSTFAAYPVDQDIQHIALYGQSTLMSSDKDSLSLFWAAAFGRADNEASLMGTRYDWTSDTLQLSAQLSYGRKLSDKLVVQGFAGLEYLAVESAGVGDGMKSGSMQNLRGSIGVGMNYAANDKTQLQGSLRFVGDMLRENPSATVADYRMKGVNPGRIGVNVGVGVTHQLNENWSLNASCNFELLEHANSQSGSVGVSYSF